MCTTDRPLDHPAQHPPPSEPPAQLHTHPPPDFLTLGAVDATVADAADGFQALPHASIPGWLDHVMSSWPSWSDWSSSWSWPDRLGQHRASRAARKREMRRERTLKRQNDNVADSPVQHRLSGGSNTEVQALSPRAAEKQPEHGRGSGTADAATVRLRRHERALGPLILVTGPPTVGKTTAARAMAGMLAQSLVFEAQALARRYAADSSYDSNEDDKTDENNTYADLKAKTPSLAPHVVIARRRRVYNIFRDSSSFDRQTPWAGPSYSAPHPGVTPVATANAGLSSDDGETITQTTTAVPPTPGEEAYFGRKVLLVNVNELRPNLADNSIHKSWSWRHDHRRGTSSSSGGSGSTLTPLADPAVAHAPTPPFSNHPGVLRDDDDLVMAILAAMPLALLVALLQRVWGALRSEGASIGMGIANIGGNGNSNSENGGSSNGSSKAEGTSPPSAVASRVKELPKTKQIDRYAERMRAVRQHAIEMYLPPRTSASTETVEPVRSNVSAAAPVPVGGGAGREYADALDMRLQTVQDMEPEVLIMTDCLASQSDPGLELAWMYRQAADAAGRPFFLIVLAADTAEHERRFDQRVGVQRILAVPAPAVGGVEQDGDNETAVFDDSSPPTRAGLWTGIRRLSTRSEHRKPRATTATVFPSTAVTHYPPLTPVMLAARAAVRRIAEAATVTHTTEEHFRLTPMAGGLPPICEDKQPVSGPGGEPRKQLAPHFPPPPQTPANRIVPGFTAPSDRSSVLSVPAMPRSPLLEGCLVQTGQLTPAETAAHMLYYVQAELRLQLNEGRRE